MDFCHNSNSVSVYIYIKKCTYPHHEIISEIVGYFNEGISDIWERRFFVCSFKFALNFSTKLHHERFTVYSLYNIMIKYFIIKAKVLINILESIQLHYVKEN